MKALTILIALILGTIRFYVPPTSGNWVDIYKDMAHVFLGMLIPAAWSGQDKLYRWVFWLLCALEVTVATVTRL